MGGQSRATQIFRLGSHTPGAGSAKSHRNHNCPHWMVAWRPQIDLLLPSWSGLVMEKQLLVGRFSRELLYMYIIAKTQSGGLWTIAARKMWTIAGSRGPRQAGCHSFSLFLSACFWIGLTMCFGVSQKLRVCMHTVSLVQVHESPFFHNQLNKTLLIEVLGYFLEPASVNMLFKTLTATILPICSPSDSSHVSYLMSVSSVSSTMPGIGLIVKKCLLNE